MSRLLYVNILVDGFPEGYFAYPFRYQLPHGLPGELFLSLLHSYWTINVT